jgi:hypothetical protein
LYQVEVPLAGELFQEGGEDLPQPGEADAVVEHLICTRPAQVAGRGHDGTDPKLLITDPDSNPDQQSYHNQNSEQIIP